MKLSLYQGNQKVADVEMISHSGGDTTSAFRRTMTSSLRYDHRNPLVFELLCPQGMTISQGNYELGLEGETISVYVVTTSVTDSGTMLRATASE